MYDIIIIGAGPAGLTAALYAKRAEKKVLILEAKSYGGQIINSSNIENYPTQLHISGFDFATNLYNQIKNLDVEIKYEKVLEITKNKEVITDNNKYNAKSIIISTGCKNRKLNIENEDKFIGKGISYCATCDGAFYKGKDVAVVGGGNTAIEEALYLSNIVNKVYIIHRRNEFRADKSEIDKLNCKNNIEIIYNNKINKIIGDKKLSEIEIINNDNKKSTIKIDGLFIAIGRIPENNSYINLINLDENGYIISNENCNTNIDGIFVAGDNRTKKLRQLVTATSDGAIAANEAIYYLKK